MLVTSWVREQFQFVLALALSAAAAAGLTVALVSLMFGPLVARMLDPEVPSGPSSGVLSDEFTFVT